MLVFSIQFTLLACILYALFIGPLVEGTFTYNPLVDPEADGYDKEAVETFPLVLQFTKFMCALILHISV